MTQRKFNRISKNSGIYKCISCEKQTRETGDGESSVEMCKKCYAFGGQENAHSDNHSGKVKECGKCRSDIEHLGYDFDDIDEWCDNEGEAEPPYEKDSKGEEFLNTEGENDLMEEFTFPKEDEGTCYIGDEER